MVKNIEKKHNQRCSECKNRIVEFLAKLFKVVKIDHDFSVSIPSKKDQEQNYSSGLKNIREALESYRGHRNFVRITKIPRCDLYVPEPGFIVELDESQHFSKARMVSLCHYPKNLPFGFKLDEWIDLCNRIKSADNDPPYRDEQRAWYDTLRDFLPFMKGLKPTVRIYMGKFRWCSLDPQRDSDIATFLKLVPHLAHPLTRKTNGPEKDESEAFYGPKWYVSEIEQKLNLASGEGLSNNNPGYSSSKDSISTQADFTDESLKSGLITPVMPEPTKLEMNGMEGLYGPKWWRDVRNQPTGEHALRTDRVTLENGAVFDVSKEKYNVQESLKTSSNPVNDLTKSLSEPDPFNREGLYGPEWYRSSMGHAKATGSAETGLSKLEDYACSSSLQDTSDSVMLIPCLTSNVREQSGMTGKEGLYGPTWYQSGSNKSGENCAIKTGTPTESGDKNKTNCPVRVATVVIESHDEVTYDERLELLNAVVNRLRGVADAILFPAGCFNTDLKFDDIRDDVVQTMCSILKQAGCNAAVCFGIDAQSSMDQFAVAINKDGILALGKKFFPTMDEEGNINLAQDPHAGELNYPRTFQIERKKAYLAVCYDSFGIRKKHVGRRDSDLILNLVHGFYPHGEGNSGEVYFAKHGFAGSSREWRCPTYSAAVFYDRKVPLNWPTGVLWNQGSMSTQKWRYQDNAIAQPAWDIIIRPGMSEDAYIRVFSV